MDNKMNHQAISFIENKTKKPARQFTLEDEVYIPGFDNLPAPEPLKPMHPHPSPDFFVAQDNSPAKLAQGLRIPPHNIEAEQNVLGGLMLSPDKLNLVTGQLVSADFYRRDHQLIYQAICELANHGQPFDSVTLGEWFTSHGKADLVGGGASIVELSLNAMSSANIQAYVEIVRNKAAQRQLLQAANDIIDSVYDPDGKEGVELLTDANSIISTVCKENMRSGELKPMESGLGNLFKELEKRQYGTISGITPQWASVKEILPKLEGGKLMVLAARPAMGKSANALQWALHAAENKQACALFSLEMGMNELLMRTLSNLSHIPLQNLQRENGLNDEDWSKITDAMRKMRQMPLAIDESGSITVEQIRARAVHFHSQCQEGLKLIVVDYLQLMNAPGKKHNNRNEEISHISRELKKLARELDCPVIVLSQLNRAVESRADKAPGMADLRDSGAIEQDADIIAFLYRPEYYSKNKTPAANDEAGYAQDNMNNVCSFHIAKNRSGPTGHATLRAELQYCRFQDGTGLSVAVAEQNLLGNQHKTVTPWRKAA